MVVATGEAVLTQVPDPAYVEHWPASLTTVFRTTVRVPLLDGDKLVHEPATSEPPDGIVGGHCPLDDAVTSIDGDVWLVQEVAVTPATTGRGHCPGSVVV